MAAQTTEVDVENSLDLEVSSNAEIFQSVSTKTDRDAFGFKSEKTAAGLEVELTSTMEEATTAADAPGAYSKESSIEKKCATEIPSSSDIEEMSVAGSGGGGGEGSVCPSPSPLGGDPDNIPEWKKELLQRRKTKIARTIGANQITSSGIKKDFKSTSPIVGLTKTLTNDNSTINISSKSSSHHITDKLVSSPTSAFIHQMTTQTPLSSSTGHYTMVNSSQSHTQPQQLCGIASNTSLLDTKSTPSSSQSLSASVTTPNSNFQPQSQPQLRSVGLINSNSNSSSDLNSQSSSTNSSFYTEPHFKCSNTSSSSNSSSSSSGTGTCRITTQSKQHQLEQPDSTWGTNMSSSQEQLQQPFQLHSKHEIVKSSLSLATPCRIASPLTINTSVTANSNTSFIKNPSASKLSSNKANKYKLSAKQNSLSPNGGSVVNSIQTKKMVAMQQMDINDASVAMNLDFDPSEELQYGPGIVSKLRCRYLSLALRQAAGKQRPPLDNLRRATSLNNLLDDDDDSNNGSVVDHTDHIEQHNKSHMNTCSTLVASPDEFVASFQKNLKISDKDKQRSRQLKRGNDSLKRARSVEALLGCDKSWDHINNVINNGSEEGTQVRQLYHKSDNSNNPYDMCSINSSADVTIEDKISHARDRILSEKTPKRLTSIISDTERPPPDVVKQTLKIFEATANRRGRGLSRNNCSGEVAAKVANYKSIISQEKPPIVFPKPPLSPKRHFKKPGSLDIACAKRNTTVNSSSIINSKKTHPASPISNLAKKFTNLDGLNESCEKNAFTQASLYHHHNQQSSGATSPLPCASGGHRAEVTLRHHRHNNFMAKTESTPIRNSFDSGSNSPSRTPDLIPRKHFEHSLFAESLSPVTQLSKKIDQQRIEATLQLPQSGATSIVQTNTIITAGPSIAPQQLNFETNDSSDLSDVEELLKQVSKKVTKNSCKGESNQENNSNKSSSSSALTSSSKSILPVAVNGNSLVEVTGFNNGGTFIEQHQGQQGQQQTVSVKQVCIIRPLLAEPKLSQQQILVEKSDSSSSDKSENVEKSEFSSSDTLNANKTRDNLVISNLGPSSSCNSLINLNQTVEQVQTQQQHQQQQQQRPALTSREIEKNLINEKKNEQAAIEASAGGAKWPFMKKKPSWSQQMTEAQNNSMVFNFKDRKDVPDYIENDGLLVKRRRELPKPNEPGFVLLGDISLETSTDPDDAWTMGPPSPCDVEFENANIIIDGKSSIRHKSKDISLKVQFDDTLTSTFEYPSESSLLEDSTHETGVVTAEITTTATVQHVKVDEIIKSPCQKLLGNMTLGSAPLGSYTPIKAQITTTFELGVTRAPTTNDVCITQNTITTTTNGNSLDNDNVMKNSTATISNGENLLLKNRNLNDTDSLPYLKPATDDHTIVYSEGSQKTDLLY